MSFVFDCELGRRRIGFRSGGRFFVFDCEIGRSRVRLRSGGGHRCWRLRHCHISHWCGGTDDAQIENIALQSSVVKNIKFACLLSTRVPMLAIATKIGIPLLAMRSRTFGRHRREAGRREYQSHCFIDRFMRSIPRRRCIVNVP